MRVYVAPFLRAYVNGINEIQPMVWSVAGIQDSTVVLKEQSNYHIAQV